MEEKKVYLDTIGSNKPLKAEILSIRKDHDLYLTITKITLKIDLTSNHKPCSYQDPEPVYVTRTIEWYSDDDRFIDDDKLTDCETKSAQSKNHSSTQ